MFVEQSLYRAKCKIIFDAFLLLVYLSMISDKCVKIESDIMVTGFVLLIVCFLIKNFKYSLHSIELVYIIVVFKS